MFFIQGKVNTIAHEIAGLALGFRTCEDYSFVISYLKTLHNGESARLVQMHVSREGLVLLR